MTEDQKLWQYNGLGGIELVANSSKRVSQLNEVNVQEIPLWSETEFARMDKLYNLTEEDIFN